MNREKLLKKFKESEKVVISELMKMIGIVDKVSNLDHAEYVKEHCTDVDVKEVGDNIDLYFMHDGEKHKLHEMHGESKKNIENQVKAVLEDIYYDKVWTPSMHTRIESLVDIAMGNYNE